MRHCVKCYKLLMPPLKARPGCDSPVTFLPDGYFMQLLADALIHHLPIFQDPATGCPAIIVFYRFRLWSDAYISPVNGAAQI